MALHDDYGDFNKLQTSDPVRRYLSEPVYTSGKDEPDYWKMTRFSSYAFSHIGMTREAANRCAKELTRNYTRNYMRWTAAVGQDGELVITQATIFECTSSIQPQLESGDNWRVNAQIEESDEIVSDHEITDVDEIEALFQAAESRDESGKLAVVSAKWNSLADEIRVKFNQTISQFNPELLSVDKQYSGQWSSATGVVVVGDEVIFDSTTNAHFRLNYNNGAILSKEWTTTDRRTYKLEITNVEMSVGESQTVSPSSPYYDGLGIATLIVTVESPIVLNTSQTYYSAIVNFNSTQVRAPNIYRIDYVGESNGKHIYNFCVETEPPKVQPATNCSVAIIPLKSDYIISTDLFEFEQEAYIDITNVSASLVDDNHVEGVVSFKSNLALEDLQLAVMIWKYRYYTELFYANWATMRPSIIVSRVSANSFTATFNQTIYDYLSGRPDLHFVSIKFANAGSVWRKFDVSVVRLDITNISLADGRATVSYSSRGITNPTQTIGVEYINYFSAPSPETMSNWTEPPFGVERSTGVISFPVNDENIVPRLKVELQDGTMFYSNPIPVPGAKYVILDKATIIGDTATLECRSNPVASNLSVYALVDGEWSSMSQVSISGGTISVQGVPEDTSAFYVSYFVDGSFIFRSNAVAV